MILKRIISKSKLIYDFKNLYIKKIIPLKQLIIQVFQQLLI